MALKKIIFDANKVIEDVLSDTNQEIENVMFGINEEIEKANQEITDAVTSAANAHQELIRHIQNPRDRPRIRAPYSRDFSHQSQPIRETKDIIERNREQRLRSREIELEKKLHKYERLISETDTLLSDLSSKLTPKIQPIIFSTDKKECGICLDDYHEGDKLGLTPCLHAFHLNCLERWQKSKENADCPYCGTPLDS